MSDPVSGVVQEVQVRQVAGGKTAYNIVVGGQSYGAGLFKPKVNEGDYVTFGIDDSRGFLNVERGTLKVGKKPANYTEEKAVPTTAPQKTAKFNSFDSKQDAISRQAASNTALTLLNLLATTESLALPANNKGKRQEAIVAQLHEYEKMFYERNTGVEWKDISPITTSSEESGDANEYEEEPADSAWE